MDTGQIMAVMQQMPAGVAAQQTGEAVVPMEQVGKAFAGLLQGMSMQKAAQTAVAGQVDPQGIAGSILPEILDVAQTAMVKMAGTDVQQAIPDQADSTKAGSVKTSREEKSDPESEGIMLDTNGAQLALLLAQMHGRMPDAGTVSASNPESPQEVPLTDQGISAQIQNVDSALIKKVDPFKHVAPETAASPVTAPAIPATATAAIPATIAPAAPAVLTPATGPEDFLLRSRAPKASAQAAAVVEIGTGKEPIVQPSVGMNIAATAPDGAGVTERDTQALVKPTEAPRPAGTIPSVPVEKGDRPSGFTFVQARDSVTPGDVSQRQQEPFVMSSPVVVVEEPVAPSTTQPQQSAAVVQEAVGTESRPLQPVQPEFQGQVATLVLTPADRQPSAVPLQSQDATEAPVLEPGMTGQQDQIQKVVRSATTTTAHAASVVSSTDDRQETVPAHEQHAATSIQKSETADTAKGIVAAPAGEKQTSSEENETPDRGMNGNMPSHAFHQQVKTESSLTAITPSGAVQSDTSRTAPAAEQVVQQVRDRLVTHETKPGSEQIVLRLSPEHLGELKVNLNMEGQRLKVEIVAENRMVRDSLMQHTDALKESLSRQNIKMDSFEVTTGGNTSADSGRSSQGDWRELAQQRQHKTWMPEGGYRLAQQAAPAMAAYKTKSEHTMVDLHF